MERRKKIAHELLRGIQRKYLKDATPPLAVFNLDFIGTNIFINGFYEKSELKCIERFILPNLRHRHLFIDVGANVGNHSAFLAPYFDKILSFEPNPRVLKLLEANAMLFENIDAIPFGLSNKTISATASYDIENIGRASVNKSSTGRHKTDFELKKLDEVLNLSQKASVSLIKLDIEGHEKEALEGAVETLKHSSPVVLLEANHSEIFNGTTKAKMLLEDYGYEFFYYLQESKIFLDKSLKFSKILNSFSILFFGRKILGHFTPKRIYGDLSSEGHNMIVASKFEFTV